MVLTHSSLYVSSSRSGQLFPLLLWLLLLAQVEANNQSGEVSEVQARLYFKLQMENIPSVPIELSWTATTGSSSTLEDNYGYWSSWKETDESPCAWIGVTCSTNSTVEELDLSGWGLYYLPDLRILSNLRDLRRLDLSSNYFSGDLPDDFQTWTTLTNLDVSNNGFNGPIPSSVSACRSLRYISLASNRFTGEIPSLQGLVNLQFLLLADNNLSGPFPKDLEEISTLVSIDLSDNLLNGTIPSLSKLANLLALKLDNNNFTEFDGPLFPGGRSLERLSISGNQLEGTIPSGITNLLSLKVLNLSRNRLSGDIPLGLSQQMNRSALDLSQNQLTGQIPVDLLQSRKSGALSGVSINLSQNLLTGGIPLEGADNVNVLLDLSHNNLTGPFPSTICKQLNALFSLYLHDNLLSGDIVDILVDCPGLDGVTSLICGNNLFTGDLSRLATLPTPDNNSLPLGTVDLHNNKLRMTTTNAILDPLRGVLEFFMNSGVPDIQLGGNNFAGTSLPRALTYPSNNDYALEALDLSNSGLAGDISSVVFNATLLENLQYQNLSNNDIGGPIPQTLVDLPNLGVLDVANNRLIGPLPFIAPNSNLNNPSFYVGNSELCGYPLSACKPELHSIVQWWVLLLIVGGSLIIALGSCLGATWRWRVYHKQHQQDADLIKTLLEREWASLMSLRALKNATDNFAKSAQIGEGGFGTVYTGKLSDGTLVAIKRSKREGTEKDKSQFLNEVSILSQVNHRHLVKLLGCCMENKVSLLVFEYISNGTLQEHLQGKFGGVHLSWEQRLNIAVQTADALNYLHSSATYPIYHRDVKSANILLNHDLNAKVADFGISKLATIENTHVSTIAVQGTIGYIDPEYYTSYQFTSKSDVYSFGVVLLELVSAKPAIDFLRGGDETSLVKFGRLHIERGDLDQFIDPNLMETYAELASHGSKSIMNVGRLAMKCVHMQSKARPSMNEVWKELQSFWVELTNTSEQLAFIIEEGNESPEFDHTILLSKSSSSNTSSFAMHNDESSIAMSQISHLTS